MLVSTIISNGQLKADMPSTSFYTAAEALFDAQTSWNDIYAILCECDDDYFLTESYTTSSSFTPVTSRTYAYTYPLASDFFRLRFLQYQGTGGTLAYYPAQRMNNENFGNTQGTPAYRLNGQSLVIYDPVGYTNWYVGYYPSPATLTSSTDLTYPTNAVFEIMVYQIAAEIRRKQNQPTDLLIARRNELLDTLRKQFGRDDAKALPIKNVFSQGFGPYI